VKKLIIFLIFSFSALFLYAQEDNFFTFDEEEPEEEEFRFKNRMVELSISNISYNLSNNFVSINDIFKNPFYMLWHVAEIKKDPVLVYKDPVAINLEGFLGGYKLIFGTAIKPLSINFNWKDDWGVGLDIAHVNVTGNLALSEKMTTLRGAKNEKFNMGMAAYADLGIPFYFHHNEFKIKIRPAAYVPLVYTRPIITYTYIKEYTNPDTGAEGSYLEVKYDMRLYSLIDLEKGDLWENLVDEGWNIPRYNMGYDFGLCVELPQSDQLDVGVNIVNIPIPFAAAKLYHYTQLGGSLSVDTSYMDMNGMTEGGIPEDAFSFSTEEQTFGYNSAGQKVYRPFVTLFYANYRPYYSPVLVFIPSLGFSINKLYNSPGSVEGGLYTRIDLANIFITTLGINYNDHAWKNSIDFNVNLRALQIDFGLSTQSSHFIKSWQGAGLGINFGVKTGW